jgi:ComF family protein
MRARDSVRFPYMPLGKLISDVLELCYPSACIYCDAPSKAKLRFCDECEKLMTALEMAGSCTRCAMPLPADDSLCAYCQGRGLRPFDRIVRLCVFDEPVRQLVHRMKYRGEWALAEILTDRLLQHDRAKSLLSDAQVLAPVPLHPFRQIGRGFNQADVIARRIARRSPQRLRVAHPVTRVRNNPPQANATSKAERLRNLRGVFDLVDGRTIAGKHVVLVDDVMTTGATLRAMARTLIPARPAKISALILAIADPKGRGFQRI